MYPSFILIRNGPTEHERNNNRSNINKSSASHTNKDLSTIYETHLIDEGLSETGRK